jgi:hypothetical protein
VRGCWHCQSRRSNQINAADFAQSEKTMSSDEFGGRKPGATAEPRTTGWLVEQFRHMGLQPGNHGAWFQSVPARSAPSVKRVNSMRRRTVLQQNKPYPFAAEAIRMRRKG